MASARFLDPASIPLKRQSGVNIWSTLLPIIQGAIIVGILSVVGLLFVPVLQTQNRHKAELSRLQVEIANAQDQQHELQVETDLMKTDNSYVEHIARDRLNMGRPGETILRFDPYSSSYSGARTAGSTAASDTRSN